MKYTYIIKKSFIILSLVYFNLISAIATDTLPNFENATFIHSQLESLPEKNKPTTINWSLFNTTKQSSELGPNGYGKFFDYNTVSTYILEKRSLVISQVQDTHHLEAFSKASWTFFSLTAQVLGTGINLKPYEHFSKVGPNLYGFGSITEALMGVPNQRTKSENHILAASNVAKGIVSFIPFAGTHIITASGLVAKQLGAESMTEYTLKRIFFLTPGSPSVYISELETIEQKPDITEKL